jgi:uncharacterized protein (DUF302 family)
VFFIKLTRIISSPDIPLVILYLLMHSLKHKLGYKKNYMTYYSIKLKMPFQTVLEKLTENLEHQGFTVITTFDFQDTFKKKLNIKFRNYKMLGACNPLLAYKAISLESHMGSMIQCNIVIQEHENGEVEISAYNPLENLDETFNTTQLVDLATETGVRLRAAVDCVRQRPSKLQLEELPV